VRHYGRRRTPEAGRGLVPVVSGLHLQHVPYAPVPPVHGLVETALTGNMMRKEVPIDNVIPPCNTRDLTVNPGKLCFIDNFTVPQGDYPRP
jgi:hypothetical protein